MHWIEEVYECKTWSMLRDKLRNDHQTPHMHFSIK